MRVITFTLSLWYDPGWFDNFKKSWKERKYWIGWRSEEVKRPPQGKVRVLELLFLDIKFSLRIGEDG